MPTPEQQFAANLARTGGVQAQLQMGRDRIQQAQLAQQQARLQQAAQYQQMQDMARMQQQQRQFESSQVYGREGRDIQQAQFAQQQAIRDASAERLQQEDVLAGQQRAVEMQGQEAMFGAMGAMEAYGQSPYMKYVNKLVEGGEISRQAGGKLAVDGFDPWKASQKLEQGAAGGGLTGRPAAALQIARELRDTRQNIAVAESAGNVQEAMALRDYYNELTASQKMFEKGFAPMGLGPDEAPGAAPGVLEFAGDIAGARVAAEAQAKTAEQKIIDRPLDEMALKTRFDSNELVTRVVGQIKTLLNEQTALGRVTLSKVPLTDANALSAALETIAANVGFGTLQEMREASKTGGALGQITEREHVLLQAVLGSLKQSLPLADLSRNLDQIVEFRQRGFNNGIAKYEGWYGQTFTYDPGGTAPGVGGAPVGGGGAAIGWQEYFK